MVHKCTRIVQFYRMGHNQWFVLHTCRRSKANLDLYELVTPAFISLLGLIDPFLIRQTIFVQLPWHVDSYGLVSAIDKYTIYQLVENKLIGLICQSSKHGKFVCSQSPKEPDSFFVLLGNVFVESFIEIPNLKLNKNIIFVHSKIHTNVQLLLSLIKFFRVILFYFPTETFVELIKFKVLPAYLSFTDYLFL